MQVRLSRCRFSARRRRRHQGCCSRPPRRSRSDRRSSTPPAAALAEDDHVPAIEVGGDARESAGAGRWRRSRRRARGSSAGRAVAAAGSDWGRASRSAARPAALRSGAVRTTNAYPAPGTPEIKWVSPSLGAPAERRVRSALTGTKSVLSRRSRSPSAPKESCNMPGTPSEGCGLASSVRVRPARPQLRRLGRGTNPASGCLRVHVHFRRQGGWGCPRRSRAVFAGTGGQEDSPCLDSQVPASASPYRSLDRWARPLPATAHHRRLRPDRRGLHHDSCASIRHSMQTWRVALQRLRRKRRAIRDGAKPWV